MATSSKNTPVGYHTVTPSLRVKGAEAVADFLKRAFDAREMFLFHFRDGTVAHAEYRIGDSVVMIGEAKEPWNPMPASLYLYVDDVDSVYKRALQEGARSLMAPTDQFWGDRQAGVADPAGNQWWIATHVEDVSLAEQGKRVSDWIKHHDSQPA